LEKFSTLSESTSLRSISRSVFSELEYERFSVSILPREELRRILKSV